MYYVLNVSCCYFPSCVLLRRPSPLPSFQLSPLDRWPPYLTVPLLVERQQYRAEERAWAQEGQTRAWVLFSTYSCGLSKVTSSEHLLIYPSISGTTVLASLKWNKLCHVYFLHGTYHFLYLFLIPCCPLTKGKVKSLRLGALPSCSLPCSLPQHTPGTSSITSFPLLLYSFDIWKSIGTKPTSHFFTRPDLFIEQIFIKCQL